MAVLKISKHSKDRHQPCTKCQQHANYQENWSSHLLHLGGDKTYRQQSYIPSINVAWNNTGSIFFLLNSLPFSNKIRKLSKLVYRTWEIFVEKSVKRLLLYLASECFHLLFICPLLLVVPLVVSSDIASNFFFMLHGLYLSTLGGHGLHDLLNLTQ